MNSKNLKNKKMKKALFILSTALIVLSSCNKNLIEDRNEDDGYILFQVASNDAMSTKATVDQSVLETYTVTIKKNSESGEQVVSQRLSAFGSTKLYSIESGTYYVAMENISQAASVEGNGAKRIFGATSVTVSAGTTATATIAGAVVNAATKIVFDDTFTTVFENYTVTLNSGVRTIPTNTNNDEIFWNPGTVSFNISARLISDHKTTVNGSGSVELSAKDYKTLTFKAGQNGKILLSITADDGMTNGSVNITVDPNTGSVSNQ